MTNLARKLTTYLDMHGWSGFRVGNDTPLCRWQVQKQVRRIDLETHARIDSRLVSNAYADALSQIRGIGEIVKTLGLSCEATGNVISNEHCHLFRYTLHFLRDV